MRRILLGLIGSGIQRSLTPALQEGEAAAHNIRCVYQLIDLDVLRLTAADLSELLLAAERMGFAGLNVTHPCKQAIVPLLTDIAEDACALGAVNTVIFREGRRFGHNTDWLAFSAALRAGIPGVSLGRIAQLGAGGGGSATAFAALKLGAREIRIIDVDPHRSGELAARLNRVFGENKARAVEDPAEALRDADGLIHATPTGMHGHPGVPIALELLRPHLWVAEIVYFPLQTELLSAAKQLGCRTIDGGSMAVGQAVEAFRLFTGLEPDSLRMRRHFLSLVEAR